MDVSDLLDELNEAQREAVTAEDGHVLVLAGAGSGKTSVITEKVAYLVKTCGIEVCRVAARFNLGNHRTDLLFD